MDLSPYLYPLLFSQVRMTLIMSLSMNYRGQHVHSREVISSLQQIQVQNLAIFVKASGQLLYIEIIVGPLVTISLERLKCHGTPLILRIGAMSGLEIITRNSKKLLTAL